MVKGDLQAAIAPAVFDLTGMLARAFGSGGAAVVAGELVLVMVKASRIQGFTDKDASQGDA